MKQPPATISSGLAGANFQGAWEEMRDANAAYTQALLWVFTGEKLYATNAQSILETYASNVTAPRTGQLISERFLGRLHFPMAADLSPGTDSDWKNDRAIARWFNDVLLPPLHYRIAFGNRELAIINALGAIGVYNGDPAAFYEALNHWVNYVPEYYNLPEDGPTLHLADYWTPEVTPSDDFSSRWMRWLFRRIGRRGWN